MVSTLKNLVRPYKALLGSVASRNTSSIPCHQVSVPTATVTVDVAATAAVAFAFAI